MKKYTYVIVEDQPDAIAMLQSKLMKFDHRLDFVGEARTGHDAIELIQKEDPDLVFMDIDLPGFDGFTVLEAFENPRFQVIFTTGMQGNEVTMNAVRSSAIDYLFKPIDQEEVDESIGRFLFVSDKDSSLRIEHFLKYKHIIPYDRVVLPLYRTYQVVLFKDIVRIETRRGSYVVFHVISGEQHIATKSLTHYEDLLTNAHFYRVHKSHMVNVRMIESVDAGSGGFVQLMDGSSVPVAFRRKKELLEILKFNDGLTGGDINYN